MHPRGFIFLTFLFLALAGCKKKEYLTESIAQSSVAAEEIEQHVGSKPTLNVHYENGSLATVIVEFPEAREKSMDELEVIVRTAVVGAFKKEPAKLIISFKNDTNPR